MAAGIALLAATVVACAGGPYPANRQAPTPRGFVAASQAGVTQSPLPAAAEIPAGLVEGTAKAVLPTSTPATARQNTQLQEPPPPTEISFEATTEMATRSPLIQVIGGADKLAFLNQDDIWIANLDGGGLTRITEDGAWKINLQWSPDGQAVHYISGKCVHSVDINSLRIDQLVCFEAADSLEAFEISPDGKRAAISLNRELFVVPFARDRLADVKYQGDLQSMAECASLAPYMHNEAGIAVKQVRWSRDGKQLAINRLGGADGKQVDLIQLLDISNCSGTIDRMDEFPATRFRMDGYETNPIIQNFAWDGGYLFALNSFKRNDGFGDLWIYSTELHRAYQSFPIEDGCCYRDPVWSPDGSHLLFAYQDRSKAPHNVIRLYFVPYASLGTGMIYAPLPLPDDLFTDPRAKPLPALRPAP